MITEEEEFNLFMYRQLGIAEWREKKSILSKDEVTEILKAIKAGISNDLIDLVKLPFPKFVEAYFSSIPSAQKSYFIDPQFAYKMYFLNDYTLQMFCEALRHPKYSVKKLAHALELKTSYSFGDKIKSLIDTKLEDFSKMASFKNRKHNYRTKYIYLTQYIDIDEARRLNLPAVLRFIGCQVENFDLEGKLRLLNPTVEKIVIYYFGLHGYYRHSMEDICHLMNFSYRTVCENLENILDFFLHNLEKTLPEFAIAIGYDGTLPNGMKRYRNEKFANLDAYFTTKAIFNTLPEEEQQFLEKLPFYAIRSYIEDRYLFTTVTQSQQEETEGAKNID